MPAWIISLEHSIQGDEVTYKVAPSLLLFDFATLVMAFASACKTYGKVRLFSSSQLFTNPEGVPLYPSEMIILSFTSKAPTCLRLQYEFWAQIRAIFRYR